MTAIEIKQIDYRDPQHAADLMMLLNAYAQDPMGGEQALDPDTLATLPAKLAELPTAFCLIAYVTAAGQTQPVGLINCFYGFSTFAAKPLINIHDVTVLPAFRGMGVSQKMLARVESIAHENGCCKLTMEVLSSNAVAMKAYAKFGFGSYELNRETGHAVCWQKNL
ncbi:MAG: ribosomal protein S18 acetylase RimI-like enzyme [Cellvibrionaceae bacterium]|jgi:ribosomal protein S18 acetylase RimI-like enzyme